MPAYRLPNGSTTDDEQLHLRLWRELAYVVETLVPGAKMEQFDLNMTFTVPGRDERLVLPVWFIETLVNTVRPMTGRAFTLSNVRTRNCESCGTPVHTSGAGRTRRFCSECLIVRTKLRNARGDES